MTSPSLLGESALVTGASRGLGRAIAQGFARAGAHVALVARSSDGLDRSASVLRDVCSDARQIVETYAGDVSDDETMQRVIREWSERAGPVTVLVNNAGIQGPIGTFEDANWERWLQTLQVDLIAPVRMTQLVLPAMRARGHGKIINISGGGATAPRPRFSAYATAKCGLVRFTETLAAELIGTGIDVNAIAPGPMNTSMLDEVLNAGAESVGPEYHKALRQRDEGGVQPEEAARLAVFLASSASDGITGRLLSAVWDPWEQLPAHRDDLANSDIYTLRRIVPKDRGKGWGDR